MKYHKVLVEHRHETEHKLKWDTLNESEKNINLLFQYPIRMFIYQSFAIQPMTSAIQGLQSGIYLSTYDKYSKR